MLLNPKETRYQNCNGITRFWRSRYLLVVPFEAVYSYLWSLPLGADRDPFSVHWSIARGMADVRRNFLYTMEEVMERLKTRIKT